MKMTAIGLLAAGLLASGAAVAQEHWTEGPVWECSAYRTNPGMFDTYMKWIRSHSEPINEEAKKQGLIIDYKAFVKPPRDENDYDVLFCTLYSSFGQALDYNKGDDDKFDKISAAHWATTDEDKQREQSAPRLEMRRYLGTSYVREVNLRPMP
ncbi:MAG TPA: hypothetical protein VIB01_02745 [Steroidobacteraceae bacterium]|jgi:hypothetical protein